jgi:hypothetical protein
VNRTRSGDTLFIRYREELDTLKVPTFTPHAYLLTYATYSHGRSKMNLRPIGKGKAYAKKKWWKKKYE